MCPEITNTSWNWCSGFWCVVHVRLVGALKCASSPNRQAANVVLQCPFEGLVDFPLVSQDSWNSIMKETVVFTLFLPNLGTTLSQLNKRHSVTNAKAQLKLEMKLGAADWLKTITQIPEAITFLQKRLIRPWILFKLCIHILLKEKSSSKNLHMSFWKLRRGADP